MRAHYLLTALLASLEVNANPFGGVPVSKFKQLIRAPDPPPAPIPLPPSKDGVLPDKSLINYNPNDPSHLCWSPPRHRPDPSHRPAGPTCSVCVLQRNGTDGSADYQLWARDNKNDAMGNMDARTIWPIDGIRVSGQTVAENQPSIAMGGTPLQIYAMKSSNDPAYSQVFLYWAAAPRDPNVQFDPAPSANGGPGCTSAGTASNGAVIYFNCSFPC